jgi:hypothetical protein
MALGGWTAGSGVPVFGSLGTATTFVGGQSSGRPRQSRCCRTRNQACYLACALNPECTGVEFDCEGSGPTCWSACKLDLGPGDPEEPGEIVTPW